MKNIRILKEKKATIRISDIKYKVVYFKSIPTSTKWRMNNYFFIFISWNIHYQRRNHSCYSITKRVLKFNQKQLSILGQEKSCTGISAFLTFHNINDTQTNVTATNWLETNNDDFMPNSQPISHSSLNFVT